MSRADAQKEILDPMQRLFLPPRDFDDAMVASVLAEYAEALERFCADDLKTAWVAVRDDHRTRAWPVIGVFVQACHKARMDREVASGGAAAKSKHTNSQQSSWRTWEAVRRTQLAQDAAARGVAWSVKCAILSGTEPRNIDLDRMERESALAETKARRIENDQPLFDTRTGRDIGVMKGLLKETALSMYRQLQISEAETAQEIGFTGQSHRKAPDIEALLA